MTDKVQYVLSRIGKTIHSIDSDAEVILYGSRVRGTSHPESDWDILILINQENFNKKREQTFRHALIDVELETGEAFSTLVLSKKEWENKYKVTPLYQNIKKEGLKI